MKKTLLSALLALPCAAWGSGPIMLQGFEWSSAREGGWWKKVEAAAPGIASAGFTLVWLPPSADSASDEGYMPRRLYVQDSKYGTEAELRSAVLALSSAGVSAIGDAVLNHRVGWKDWADFDSPAWSTAAVTSDDEWGKGTGAPDTGKAAPFARDLDHTSPEVARGLSEWMGWLRREIGYSGWRYDFARGFDPRYLLAYDSATASAFSVAEVWDDLDLAQPEKHRKALTDWLSSAKGRIRLFDFTTKGLLQEAASSGDYSLMRDRKGRPAGLIGVEPGLAVTFVDNHDTLPRADGYKGWPFPATRLAQGYAYILTHPGVPCVYWPHFFDPKLGPQIVKLMKIRRKAGLEPGAKVRIEEAGKGLYAAIVDKKIAVALGTRSDWDPGGDWLKVAAGLGYRVWVRR